jgi:predicted transposase YbfD/YdcC
MTLGFARAQAERAKQSAKKAFITPIAEIQANLSSYFSEIKDPRVTRTKKHLLKDIIDGKCLRGSYDRESGLKALHLVTAWVAQQNLTLGQIKVEDHSNEITAIPALLELIDVTGAIVTIDAMGTQTDIVRLIREKKKVLQSLTTTESKRDIIVRKKELFEPYLCPSLVVSTNKNNG